MRCVMSFKFRFYKNTKKAARNWVPAKGLSMCGDSGAGDNVCHLEIRGRSSHVLVPAILSLLYSPVDVIL